MWEYDFWIRRRAAKEKESRAGIVNDACKLTPNPFFKWKGNRTAIRSGMSGI